MPIELGADGDQGLVRVPGVVRHRLSLRLAFPETAGRRDRPAQDRQPSAGGGWPRTRTGDNSPSRRPLVRLGHTDGMPELPEVAALASFLAEHTAGQRVVAVSVTSLNVLTTYDPPASALVGRYVRDVRRHGKFLDIVTVSDGGANGPVARRAGDTERSRNEQSGTVSDGEANGPVAELHLVLHLARAGWLRWSDEMSATPPKLGGPIALRVRFDRGRVRHHRGRDQEVRRRRDRRRRPWRSRGSPGSDRTPSARTAPGCRPTNWPSC